MFLAFEIRMLLSLPTAVPIAKSHSIKTGWIIGMDSPDFPTTAQLSWQQRYGAFSVSDDKYLWN